jgi:hypothetical protein
MKRWQIDSMLIGLSGLERFRFNRDCLGLGLIESIRMDAIQASRDAVKNALLNIRLDPELLRAGPGILEIEQDTQETFELARQAAWLRANAKPNWEATRG